MRKFFPNIETAIIFVFLLCVALWGVSRCKKKKDDAAITTATEATINSLDTISPAASRGAAQTRPPIPNVISQSPTTQPPPQYGQGSLPNSPSTTPPPSSIPQAYSQAPVQQQPQALPVSPGRAPMPSTAPTPTTPKSTTETPTSTSSAPSSTMLYVLINGLNVRANPDLKAKSKGRLKLNDQVYFLDEKSEITQTVRLADGTSVTKPWFKIQTKRGTVGWVHGSGVDFYKRKPAE